MNRPLSCAALAILAAVLLFPAGAGAYYADAAEEAEGAQLVSADYARLEQGDDSSRFGAISADGRFVAIQTRSRNFFADDDPDPPGDFRAGGIFRFDMQTRALRKVADGDLFRESDGALLRRGAANPSISADGRFVVFSTAAQLVPADTNDNVDVYVRDMDKVESEPGAFQLVSARDGGDTPAGFSSPSPLPTGAPGAEVSPEVAISADGSRVAFRTEAESDLPAQAGISTPPGQVFVRDLQSHTTSLVTAKRDPLSGSMTGEPAGGALGAALSADGSTVAWTGRNAAAQTRFLGGENTDPSFNYYLWRRAPFGTEQETRRITGLSDPDDPVCRREEEEHPGMITTFDPNQSGPCFGPLTDQEATRSDIGGQLPALSADGFEVAFLTGAGPRPLVQSAPNLDLYVTNMSPGLSRKQATTELTRDSPLNDTANSSPITSVAMSASGRYLAITSSRTQFLLPALQLAGTARTVPGPPEIYVVDLQAHTVERVAHSISGGDVDAGAQSGVTLSSDASRIAFSSFAGNLFVGDANQRPDVFVATRLPNAVEAPPPAGGAGAPPSIKEDRGHPVVSVSAKSKKHGVLVLTISVPAAGSVNAVATARAGKPPRTRKVATRQTRARGRGTFHVVMRAESSYLSAGTTLKGRVKVTFKPTDGGKSLHASTAVTFSG
jgi:Tol biopolymer transport system component